MIDEPSADYFSGHYAMDVLRDMPRPLDNSRAFHDAVQAALRAAGFSVRREAYVGIRESGRPFGYIDLLAQYQDGFVAIELDNRTPRAGSLDKLRAFKAFRLLVLRGDRGWTSERGIDAIINVPVRLV